MVRGATKEQRDAARVKLRAQRRAGTYGREFQAADTAKGRFTAACRFLKAVVDDLGGEEQVDEVTRQVLRLANERNKP